MTTMWCGEKRVGGYLGSLKRLINGTNIHIKAIPVTEHASHFNS